MPVADPEEHLRRHTPAKCDQRCACCRLSPPGEGGLARRGWRGVGSGAPAADRNISPPGRFAATSRAGRRHRPCCSFNLSTTSERPHSSSTWAMRLSRGSWRRDSSVTGQRCRQFGYCLTVPGMLI